MSGRPLSANPEARAGAVGAVDGRALRILVADDAEDIRLLMRLYLSKLGCEVTLVRDGEEAVLAVLEAVARGAAPDVVLMDLEMPVLDGLKATRRLRGEGFEHPVVALTAHASGEVINRARAAGMSEHLQKPVRRRTLEKAVERWRESVVNHAPTDRTTFHSA